MLAHAVNMSDHKANGKHYSPLSEAGAKSIKLRHFSPGKTQGDSVSTSAHSSTTHKITNHKFCPTARKLELGEVPGKNVQSTET